MIHQLIVGSGFRGYDTIGYCNLFFSFTIKLNQK
jgi:hypothetical protein